MTDISTSPTTPHISIPDFISNGLDTTTLEEALDCSICLQPLLTSATNIGRTSQFDQSLPRVCANESSTSPDELIPEMPVRIRPCRHIFGRTCLIT